MEQDETGRVRVEKDKQKSGGAAKQRSTKAGKQRSKKGQERDKQTEAEGKTGKRDNIKA